MNPHTLSPIDSDDLGPSPEFLADEDIARDEDNYGRERRCTCGRDDYYREQAEYPAYGKPEPWHGPTCKGCDPVDHECKPHGFGIERFEDPALLEANDHAAGMVILSGSMYRSPVGVYSSNYSQTSDTRRAARDARWQANSKHSKRRERHSDIVWDRLCDCCETHSEAVHRYKAWAKKAIRRKYRDE